MNRPRPLGLPLWSLILPGLACALLAIVWGTPLSGMLTLIVAAGLIGSVVVAVEHAEVVAHRVGEPFGALILALAVTVIEVSLIVSLKLFGGEGQDSLARDTVFATVMIVCNGIVGLCLLAGALRHRVAVFRVEGSAPALAVLIPLTTLALVLPKFTTTTPGPTYSTSQLAFAGLMSLLLFGVYVFVQTIRHRDYFLPVGGEEAHDEPPARTTATLAFLLLCASLVAVVGLAKTLAPDIEASVAAIGAPSSFVGVIIALIVLLPETGAAFRAAVRNRMQISLNLALGSALATIGLTIEDTPDGVRWSI